VDAFIEKELPKEAPVIEPYVAVAVADAGSFIAAELAKLLAEELGKLLYAQPAAHKAPGSP